MQESADLRKGRGVIKVAGDGEGSEEGSLERKGGHVKERNENAKENPK